MARTFVTAQSFPLSTGASYFPPTPLTAGSASITLTSADTVNNNYATLSAKQQLFVLNIHPTSTFSVTIHSVADAQGRTGDITSYGVAALTLASFGPFNTSPAGWAQTSPAGLWFDGTSTNLQFAVVNLP